MWYKDSMKRKNENGIVDRETGWFTTLAASGNQDPWKKELHPGLMSVRITGRSGMMDNFNNAKNEGAIMTEKDIKLAVWKLSVEVESDITMYNYNLGEIAKVLVSENPTLADDLVFHIQAAQQDKEAA